MKSLYVRFTTCMENLYQVYDLRHTSIGHLSDDLMQKLSGIGFLLVTFKWATNKGNFTFLFEYIIDHLHSLNAVYLQLTFTKPSMIIPPNSL